VSGGGLTRTLAARANQTKGTPGDAEIWQAHATGPAHPPLAHRSLKVERILWAGGERYVAGTFSRREEYPCRAADSQRTSTPAPGVAGGGVDPLVVNASVEAP
jgi:hypothetical protein